MKTLKIAIQKSGRLNEKSVELLKNCGLNFENYKSSLISPVSNFPLEILFLRDGTVQEVKIMKPSGSYTLDNSAYRAVLDANPLPPFPRGFNFSSVKYDLTFGLDQ